MSADSPSPGAVGFFDSGIGGRCIVDAFRKLCPREEIVYVADTENCPYGNKTREEIVKLSEASVEKLLARNCRLIVVACNTATAHAITHLRGKYPSTPFVGIEPAIKPAAIASKSGVVGVLATRATIESEKFRKAVSLHAGNVRVVTAVADEFVAAVERGEVSGEGTERMVRQRVEPLLDRGADMIVLGCTHFPHLKTVIENVCAARAEVIDPSAAVAREIKRRLEELNMRSAG